jgi:hypothetical protein
MPVGKSSGKFIYLKKKNKEKPRAGRVAQVVECLPSMRP